MDWSNERYVRAYTRDTADYRGMCWQARLLWWELLRKADRSGVIETKHGAKGIAALLAVPIEVAEAGLADLLADGCLIESSEPPGYLVPNYLAANETPMTEAERKRLQRERATVTKRPDMSGQRPKVSTQRDQVTKSPDSVTPNRTEPNLTRISPPPPLAGHETSGHPAPRVPPASPVSVPAVEKPKPKPKLKPKKPEHTAEELATVRQLLDKLGEHTRIRYEGGAEHTRLIVNQLRAGRSRWDLRRVIGYCAFKLGWRDDEERRAYLRPETLFGPKTIERYLDAARAAFPQSEADEDKPKRAPPAQVPPDEADPSWMHDSTWSDFA